MLLLAAWLAASWAWAASPSYTLSGRRARELGVRLADNQRLDPWTGLVLQTDLRRPPGVGDEALVADTLARMRRSEDPCERLSAMLVDRDKTRVAFAPLGDVASGGPEGLYVHDDNLITINSDAPYLYHPSNLAKKIVHESFHRVQSLAGWIEKVEDTHDYSHRERILGYLHAYFPARGCALPEVPPAARNKVPDRYTPPSRRLDLPRSLNLPINPFDAPAKKS